MVTEDCRPLFPFPSTDEQTIKPVTEKDIVPEDQAGIASLNEIGGKQERLCDAFRFRLHDVFEGAPPLTAVSEELAELSAVVWRGDDGNFSDTRQHEHR